MKNNNIELVLKALNPLKDKIAFKGGTSLYIKYEFMKRMSVDVDIMFLGDEVKEEIVDILRSQDFEVNSGEKGDYGWIYILKHSSFNNNEEIALDVSKYILDEIPNVTGSNIVKGINRVATDKVDLDGVELMHFNTSITFFEKLLAASSFLNSWDKNDNDQNKKRKIRHLEDIARLYKNDIINFTQNKFRNIALKNEIFQNQFEGIQHWSDLSVFDNNLVSVIETSFNEWQDEYLEGGSKLEWQEIISLLKLIKNDLKGKKFINSGSIHSLKGKHNV